MASDVACLIVFTENMNKSSVKLWKYEIHYGAKHLKTLNSEEEELWIKNQE